MSQTDQLFEHACARIPGGVNSPARTFQAVGGTPRFARSASGSHIQDEQGRDYIDYVGSYGPMILGHAHPEVVAAVRRQAGNGLSFGAPTVAETEMAELLCRLVPSMEQVRMVNSGTEATMSAIRLARAHTARDKVLKFEGCYHGHGDGLLVKAGSGSMTLGEPSSPGVPADYTRHTPTATYNDAASVREAFETWPGEIACVIVEPVAGNMGCVPPKPGFLESLRECCDRDGAILIFDEVMSGFRVALGGAQARYGVRPDLTTLGKIIGGGLPVGAFGGRGDIMERLSPLGPVYQAGTLSGNPVAMQAGLATLKEVMKPGFHDALEKKGEFLEEGFIKAADEAGVPLVVNRVGAMFTLFFTEASRVSRHDAVKACDTGRYAAFFHAMLDSGVWLAPSAFEAAFLSSAHSQADLEETLQAAFNAFHDLVSGRVEPEDSFSRKGSV